MGNHKKNENLRKNRVVFLITDDELNILNKIMKELKYDNRSELFRNEFLYRLVKNG